MDCSATVFVDEFSNFFNIFCRFDGAWLPGTFVIFSWHLSTKMKNTEKLMVSSEEVGQSEKNLSV
jgi:hypothetical protein